MTFAALRLPAGNASPILSNLSLRYLPPFFDLALKENKKANKIIKDTYIGHNNYIDMSCLFSYHTLELKVIGGNNSGFLKKGHKIQIENQLISLIC